MDGEFVGQIAAFRHLDRVYLADEVCDSDVRRGELFAVTLIWSDPGDLQPVTLVSDARPAGMGDRLKGIFVQLAPRDDRYRLIKQPHQAADHPRLRLAPFSEDDNVLPREDRVLQL